VTKHGGGDGHEVDINNSEGSGRVPKTKGGVLRDSERSPSGVIRVGLTSRLPLPVHPNQRTSLDQPDWSGLCPGCVKSLSFNLRVERLSQFRRYRKQLHSEHLSRVDN